MILLLLSAFGAALIVSALACLVALQLFPWFRSGERKTGDFRPDQSGGGSGSQQIEIASGQARRSQARLSSSELPLVGGAAMVLAVVAACAVAGFLLNFSLSAWELLGVLMAAFLGFALVGFIDDARKVYKGSGISELQKFIGVFLVAAAAAAGLNRLLTSPALSARLAYSPYKDLPFLGSVLVNVHYTWLAFFLILTVGVTTTTALAVDFSDGVDGLAGGLLLSASLSYAVILLDEGASVLWPLTIGLLAIAGATLGYLPFNWPSSWRGGANANGKRRAKLIMGDTGSLALGGVLALIAIVSRLELLLILIGGAFVLEGISALMQGRILVRIFRQFLFVERFDSAKGFPHTEFPLPFLATPMHHHYELLGWDRRRLVYGAWLLGAGLGVLGIASVMGPFTWERYLARFAGFLLLLLVWQVGPWTHTFFVGLTPTKKGAPDAPRFLALYYGAPFKLFGWPLYARIDVTHATRDAFATTAERLSLWQLMNVFDARSLLGYYAYQADQLEDAIRIWGRIPKTNLRMRPEISQLLTESRHRLALETLGGDAPLSRVVNDGAPFTERPEGRAPVAATGARITGAPVPVVPNGSLVSNGGSGVNVASAITSGAAIAGGIAVGATGEGGARATPPLTGRRTTPPLRTIGQVSQLGRAGQGGPRTTGAPVSPVGPGLPINPTAANGATGQGGVPGNGADPNASAWRMSKPTTGIHPIPRLQPTEGQAIPETTVAPAPIPASQPLVADEPMLWSALAWAAANPNSVQQDDATERQTGPLPIITTPLAAVAPEAEATQHALDGAPAPSIVPVAPTPDASAVRVTPDASAPAAAPSAESARDLAPTSSVARAAPRSRPLIVPTLTPTSPPNSGGATAIAAAEAAGVVGAGAAPTPDAPDAPATPVAAMPQPTAPQTPSLTPPETPAQEIAPDEPLAQVTGTLAVVQDSAETPTTPRVAKVASGQTTAQEPAEATDEPAPFVPPTIELIDLPTDGGEAGS